MTSSPTPPEGAARPSLVSDHSQPPGRSISHSQLSHKCLLALKFARERQPWPFRGIALVYGSCLHAGLESWHYDRNLEAAIRRAHLELMTELGRAPEVRFDSRQRRGSKTSAIPDVPRAEEMLIEHLTAYHDTYKDEAFRVLDVEKVIYIELKRPDTWRVHCRIDAVIETAAGAKVLLDYKTSGKPWTETKLQSHLDQMHLYLAAETRNTGRAPDYGEYRVFTKGSDEIQTFRVEFDIAAVNRLIEHKVRPTIAAIENNAFIANTDWFGHDPRWCGYYSICPFGTAADGRTA